MSYSFASKALTQKNLRSAKQPGYGRRAHRRIRGRTNRIANRGGRCSFASSIVSPTIRHCSEWISNLGRQIGAHHLLLYLVRRRCASLESRSLRTDRPCPRLRRILRGMWWAYWRRRRGVFRWIEDRGAASRRRGSAESFASLRRRSCSGTPSQPVEVRLRSRWAECAALPSGQK